MTQIYIGIDPGSSGGLAALGSPDGVHVQPMPATERDVWEWVSAWPAAVAVVERVGGFIAGSPAPGSAMFNFGWSYGGLRMALVAAGTPFEEVTPQRWQKEFGLTRGKDETKTSYKNRLKAKAQQLFPGTKVTLAVADALLLAEYCRRTDGVRRTKEAV